MTAAAAAAAAALPALHDAPIMLSIKKLDDRTFTLPLFTWPVVSELLETEPADDPGDDDGDTDPVFDM